MSARVLRRLAVALLSLAPLSLLAAPRRVISLIPSNSEIVRALGAEGCLVAVSDAEPEKEFPGLPRVGGLQPAWEPMIALRPDLILADVSHRRYEKDFRRFRLPVEYLGATKARDIEDVFALVRHIGGLLDRRREAEALAARLEARLKAVEALRPAGPGPRVYFEIWPRPIQACAPESLQGRLIERAGGRNIVPPSANEMPMISPEWVALQAPEVILHTGVVENGEILRRPGW